MYGGVQNRRQHANIGKSFKWIDPLTIVRLFLNNDDLMIPLSASVTSASPCTVRAIFDWRKAVSDLAACNIILSETPTRRVTGSSLVVSTRTTAHGRVCPLKCRQPTRHLVRLHHDKFHLCIRRHQRGEQPCSKWHAGHAVRTQEPGDFRDPRLRM